MRKTVKRFLGDEGGATAIEYSLLLSGIALAIVAAITLLGDETNNIFAYIATQAATLLNP